MDIFYIIISIVVIAVSAIIYQMCCKQQKPEHPLKKYRLYYADIHQHSLSHAQIDMMSLFLAGYPPKTKENAKGRIVIADGGSIVYRTATLRSLILRGYLTRTGGNVELGFVTRKKAKGHIHGT